MKRKLITIFMILIILAANIPVFAAEEATDIIIAAEYGTDGRLMSVRTYASDEVPEVGRGFDTMKILRWNDLDSCRPIADAMVIGNSAEPTRMPEYTSAPTSAPSSTVPPTELPEQTSEPSAAPEPPAQTSEPTEGPTLAPGTFIDMPDGRTGEALQRVVDEGILSGYEDGTIRADAPVTRADMADIIVRIIGVNENSEPKLIDVEEDAWYREAAQKAVTIDAMGTVSSRFEPDRSLTCEEAYKAFAKIFQFESYMLRYISGRIDYATKADTTVLDEFEDRGSVSENSADYAAAVVGNGGFKGFDGLLKGSSDITRGELACLLDELIGTYIDEPGTYTDADVDSSRSILVRSGGVVFEGVTTDRNLIIAYSVDETGFYASNIDVGLVTAVMGGADPKMDLNDLKSYVKICGRLRDVRVSAPYIYLDLSGAEMTKDDYIKGCKNSRISLGVIGG